MNFKLIPNERFESQNPNEKTKKTHVSKNFAKHAIFKNKKSQHPQTSYRLLQSLSLRLHEYVKREGKQTSKEIGILITDMQKTIANLQKKRIKLIEKEIQKTTRTKKKKNAQFQIHKIR
ncbi:hypothetical protein KKD70_02645 [Patescibacteria group bacterium]|nr:hypothetical protein [Patescibacteria group bacterium]